MSPGVAAVSVCGGQYTPVMYETQQAEFRHTDRKRFTEHLLRNGPRAVAEFEKARERWAHRAAP